MIRGTAEWRTGKSRFELDAGSFLVLNHDQPYSITVNSVEPVETFCIFFARGFVEDAWRSLTSADSAMLDDPDERPLVGFFERLRPRDEQLSHILTGLREGDAEAWMDQAAFRLCELRGDLKREIARVPALRASTREELHRRVHLGKQALDEMFDGPLTLEGIARLACLSPFHFHRAFTAAFGVTPHAYRTRRRLEKAARLLAETDRQVLEICLESGFESPATFATLFRKRFGASPRGFREFARSKKSAGVFYSTMLP
jgi:AraC family transcriptional regulator